MNAEPVPHYVTLPKGQLRLWRAGAGADLVAVAGLTLAASVTATRLAVVLPGWRITVVELPGIGGSSAYPAETHEALAHSVSDLVAACGLAEAPLLLLDLAAALGPLLAAPERQVLSCGAQAARAWAAAGLDPGDLSPRQDGTHLMALWSFLRDRHLLEPDDSTQAAREGEPLPTPEELDATVTAAGVCPERFAALWRLLLARLRGSGQQATLRDAPLLADLASLLPAGAGATTSRFPETKPTAGNALWHHYVETPRGRLHLRRAGATGRPTLVIPTGGGSSAQFASVVEGLAAGGDRQVFAVDYFGNGLSDRPEREVSTETLAEDMAALVGALGFDSIDVWGSHTGALVGLELAVRYPALVRRAVLEGPVFISQDFQSDLLAHYFPPIAPDAWGRHLPLVWNWRRDMFMYWPWYRVERQAARRLGVPSASQLHLYAIGILESGPHYDRAYRSAFAYDTRSRMPLLRCPTLVCAGPNDMLVNGLDESRKLAVAGMRVVQTPTTVWWPDPDPAAAAETMALYRAFLDG